MPFTFCHSAIVIPLHRCAPRFTSLPALVIGSMAPDLALCRFEWKWTASAVNGRSNRRGRLHGILRQIL
ncbi:DUF4184 family protein [Massilia scottii]|uniref:DUF4184 family protein n=1 Tax=Massilia scottii TaxID=3057166 RepID=UPI0035B53726